MRIATALITFSIVAIAGGAGYEIQAHEINPKVIEKITGEVITHDHPTDEAELIADPRNENRTYYSFPEWYIVYSAQEYGAFVTNDNRPSQFPYLASIKQQWQAWNESQVLAGTPPDRTTKTVLWTISLSYTAETAIAGLYENTFGRVSEWLNFGHKTIEDTFIDKQAVLYGDFLNQTPWYEFPYISTLGGLWSTWGWSSLSPRGIERRLVYSVGYGTKALYASIIRFASNTTFEGGAGLTTTTLVIGSDDMISALNLPSASTSQQNTYKVTFPRYRAFKDPAVLFSELGGDFISIEEHQAIALSVLARTIPDCDVLQDQIGYSMEVTTQTDLSRYVLSTSVSQLAKTIRSLSDCGYQVEHIYDY